VTLTLAVAVLGATVAGFQLKTPTDWKWRTDAPVTVTDARDPGADQWYYVGMPPGWHVTTKPGVVLYNPAHQGRGNFTLQSEIFLFPGDNQEEYGIFLGGQSLEQTSTAPTYIAFVARRDGKVAILRRTGSTTTPVVDWKDTTAVVPQAGAEAMKNVFKVDVGPVDIVFTANDKEVARTPRAGVNIDGAVGLRVGPSLNMHVSTFDVTYRLAPAPVKK
jgi:hypothetical protein